MTRLLQPIRRIAAFYLSWRALLLATSAILLIVGVYTDGWWSKPLAILAVVPLLVMYALTGTRVGDHDARLGRLESRAVPQQPIVQAAEPVAERPASEKSRQEKMQRRSERATARLAQLAAAVGFDAHEPLVTVVIPNYNDASFIGDAIDSLKAQTLSSFRCVIVDDCSTDDSVSRISRRIANDDRFELVRHSINSGLSASRNTGLRMTDTPFVCFLDSDDFFFVDNLELRVEELLASLDDDSLVGVFSGVSQRPEDISFKNAGGRKDWKGPLFHDLVTTRGECPFNCHAPLLRTDVLVRFGGFDESMLHGAEDWDLWLRLMRNGYWFSSIPFILAIYRQKARSMVRTMPVEHLAESKRLIDSAHEPMQPAEIVAGSPFPMTEPVGYYQRKIQFARRGLQYAAMASLTEDASALGDALAYVDGGIWPVIRRHMNVDAVIDSGLMRGLSIDQKSFAAIGHRYEETRSSIKSQLASQTSPPADSVPQSGVDVLFAPSTAEQAQDMLAASEHLRSNHSVAFLRADRHIADSGVADVLSSEGVSEVSFNRWAMAGPMPSVLVVQWPFGPILSEAVEAVGAVGATTVELSPSGNEIDRLPDAASLRCDQIVGAAELAAVVAAAGAPESRMPSAHPRRTPHGLAAIEEYPNLPPDGEQLRAFKDKHKGERCVIIGNGPSLNDLDLTLLKTESTIGVNGIFYAESITFPLTYYVVEDSSVMKENLERIRSYEAGHKFFPTIYRKMYTELPGEPEDNVTFFTMNRGFYAPESPNYCVPRFSTDASQRLFCGQSVTMINLQLAYYMGFSEVALIGMDFNYTIPEEFEQEGDIITSTDDDPNHFHPDYFGKGKTWKDPKLERVMNNYQIAKSMFEADGRRIVNATAGGKLELFDRVDFSQMFS